MAPESRLEVADLIGPSAFSPAAGDPAHLDSGDARARQAATAELERFVFANAVSIAFFPLGRLLQRIYPDRRGVADRAALPIDHETLLYYVGLFAPHQRSATALEQLISDFFGVEVTVVQFAGGWYEIDSRTQCTVGEDEEDSGQLGFGAVVGDAVYDPQAGVRIRLGPLSRQRYAEFLPGGSARDTLRELVRFFADDYLDVELQLILRGDDVPLCQLGEELDAPLALGWYTWLPSRDGLSRDPDDTLLSLDRG
jgi:predicted component of type VI protein secretion system